MMYNLMNLPTDIFTLFKAFIIFIYFQSFCLVSKPLLALALLFTLEIMGLGHLLGIMGCY